MKQGSGIHKEKNFGFLKIDYFRDLGFDYPL